VIIVIFFLGDDLMPDMICDRIARMIVSSRDTVVLTGAGISTESGIPDFRSPGTGIWQKVDPMEALSTDILYGDPKRFYDIGFKILSSMKGAKPNKAHILLAAMEREGLISGIITQNIDSLHNEAGSRNIMEVHGHIRAGHCIKCGKTYKFDEIESKVDSGEIPPRCTCGGMLRPDVVMFGDNLPECFNRAWEISGRCELMVVIGSSLQVGPVNQLPGLAQKVVIINYGETAYDNLADVIYREKASAALSKIYDKIQEINKNDGQ
jgi:NAD-dependent deacetylase